MPTLPATRQQQFQQKNNAQHRVHHTRRGTNEMTAVKICGIMNAETAQATVTAGADLLGMVFAESRRQITVDQARHLSAVVRHQVRRQMPHRVWLVGLFVNAPADEINTVAETCGLDFVQLSGDEMPEAMAAVRLPVIKTIRLNGSDHDAAWIAHATDQQPTGSVLPNLPLSSKQPAVFRLLVDANVPGKYGGSGTLANWEQATPLAAQHPILLAGGLTPHNVSTAIHHVQPWGVDVSSGVETEGSKDPRHIAAFIQAVRAASLA